MNRAPIKRLVFWQNLNSHHQAPYLEELHRLGEHEVHWVVERDVASSDRAGMGWPTPKISFPLDVAPSPERMQAILDDRKEETLHIFTGIHGVPMVRQAHRLAIRSNARLALLNEAPIPAEFYGAEHGAGRLKNAVRPLIHKAHQILYGRRVEAVWAIGPKAVDWYRRLGYPEERIFPWAYFPPLPEPDEAGEPPTGDRLELLYLGQASYRKGPDVLIEALGPLRGQPWRLRFAGEGPLLETCQALARQYGIEDQIEWLGFLPHGEAMAAIRSSDVVVVPSRHDGWGAVVNEALTRGIPVICTDGCGSSNLISDANMGDVVHSGEVQPFANSIVERITTLSEQRQSKIELRARASRLSPKKGAIYFANSILSLSAGSTRPNPPWSLNIV